jgi:hypothetical protein
MGFIFDIVGSMAIRGAIVLVVLNLTITLNTALYDKSAQANVKAIVGVAAEVMHKDLRLAGYNRVGAAFETSEPDNMEFYADLDDNGTVELVRFYEVEDPDPATTSKLYRSVNGESLMQIGKNLTDIKFLYYDANGVGTTEENNVKSVKVVLEMLVEGVTTSQSKATREFRIFPMNL